MDKTALQALIDSVLAMDELTYTPSTWDALQAELVNAQAVNDDVEATQPDIDAATGDLQTAVDALVERADKAALQSAISDANTKEQGDYTPASWGPFSTALANAQTVYDDAEASQTQVNDAADALSAASDDLVSRADKTGLSAAINAAEELVESDYTPSTWGEVATQLSNAQAVMGDLDATQAAVSSATSALNDAVEALIERANKGALQAAIDIADDKLEGDHTPSTWAPFATALSAANAVIADAEATQAEVDNATSALTTATNNLVESADKMALQGLIDEVLALEEEDYTPSTWAPVSSALSVAQSVEADAEATQAAVNNAVSDLQSAKDALVELADKTALQDAISSAEEEEESDYTPSTWSPFADALASAQVVNGDIEATQSEVDQATANLTTASANLVEVADKAALQSLIADVQDLEETDYTPSSWNALTAALSSAQTVQADVEATQAAVDAAVADLQSAQSSLVERADKAALSAALAQAADLQEGDYTPSTWSGFQTAHQDANAVYENNNATQSQVDGALSDLNDAMAALVERADTSSLQALVDGTANLEAGDYSPESWAPFEAAYSDATAILEDANASQTAVDDAHEALRYAEAFLLSVSGCQVAFTSDDEDLLEYLGLDPFTSSDSTLRRIAMVADGVESNVGIHSEQGTSIDLKKPWHLGARVQVTGDDPSQSAGVVAVLYAIDASDYDNQWIVRSTFNGVSWSTTTQMTEEQESAPVVLSNDLPYGISLELIRDATHLSTRGGDQDIISIVPDPEIRSLRFVLALYIPASATGDVAFTMDALTNAHSPSICSAIFQSDSNPERNEKDLQTVTDTIADFSDAMAPGKTLSDFDRVRRHLSMLNAFSTATARDERLQTTEALYALSDAFTKDEGDTEANAFDPVYMKRSIDLLCSLYPSEAQAYLAYLKDMYAATRGAHPAWLDCDSPGLCDCIPPSLAVYYTNYLNHL